MRKQIQKTSKSYLGLKKLLIFCIGLFLILCVTYFIVTSAYQLENVTVVGSVRYTEDEIKDYLIKSKSDQLTFMLYFKDKFKDPVSIPFVESYSISMKDRHTIQVTVYEKILIGCVKLLDSYMYFDRDGLVVESSKERIEGIPLITGLKFDKILLHEKLEIQKNNLYDMILNLTKTIQKFEINVDKVMINSDYEVTLICYDNEVLLGKKDYYDAQLEALASVLKSSSDMKLSYDMRFYDDNNKKITAEPMD